MENKQKLAVIADNATATGFRLAGVEHTFALTGESAEKKLAELLSDSTFGILIVTERHCKASGCCNTRLARANRAVRVFVNAHKKGIRG